MWTLFHRSIEPSNLIKLGSSEEGKVLSDGWRLAKVDAPGLVNFIPAVAYHFCLNLPAASTKHGAST